MGKRDTELQPDQIAFIGEQHLDIVSIGATDSRLNLSPTGVDSLCTYWENRNRETIAGLPTGFEATL